VLGCSLWSNYVTITALPCQQEPPCVTRVVTWYSTILITTGGLLGTSHASVNYTVISPWYWPGNQLVGRSWWPRGLRSRSAADRLLGSRGSNPTGGMDVCFVWIWRDFTGRGLCEGTIPRPEEFYPYQVWCVWEWSDATITLYTYNDQVEEVTLKEMNGPINRSINGRMNGWKNGIYE